ncbi:MAG: GNVR domain-containing protein [Acidobacteriota bacterium]
MKNIQNLQLEDYFDILKRRILWILVPGVIIWFITFLFAQRLPNVYVSETLILVEPPKVPTDYVRPASVGTIQSRLSTITQQIMSRTRLEKIILDNNLYAEKRHSASMEEVVEKMRSDISLNVTKTDAFALSYRAYDPILAQKVTSQIASLYIEENLKVRSEQTEGVSEFLESQLKETESKLREQEDRMREFKSRFMGGLPEQQAANLATLNRLQLQLQASQESISRLQDQRAQQKRLMTEYESFAQLGLGVEVSVATSAVPSVADPASRELEKKKADRDAALLRYTKNHPDVRKLESEIRILEERISKQHQPVDTALTDGIEMDSAGQKMDPNLLEMRTQLQSLDFQIQQAKKDQDRIRNEMAIYQARVDSVPRLEQLQKEISRDYEMTQQNYRSLLAKKNEAAMAANLEKRQKGEQFRILDPASLPEKPSEPNRLRLNLAGLAAGLAFGLLLSLVLELRDESVRSEREVAQLTQLPVLVSIPLIGERQSKETSLFRSPFRVLSSLWRVSPK